MDPAAPVRGPGRPSVAPLLGLFALLAPALALLLAGPAAPAGATGSVESRGVALVNAHRAAHGLAPLTVHRGLAADARAWASHMAAEWRLTHSPDLRSETVRSVPDWRRAAENIGYGPDIDRVIAGFMGSPGHRAHILGDYDVVGVGVAQRNGRTWVTVRFASSPAARSRPTVAGFRDVPADSYFAAGVTWMRDRGITTGVGGSDRFEPRLAVTRAQLAAFLHRMVGEPPGRGPGFPDVATGAYFADPVRWLRAEGITNGFGTTGRFLPHRAVSRAEVATFLWRLAGSPATGTRHRFVDVPASHFAAEAVAWMARHRITTGVDGSNRFAPSATVDRAQAATFLHRLASTPAAWAPGSPRP